MFETIVILAFIANIHDWQSFPGFVISHYLNIFLMRMSLPQERIKGAYSLQIKKHTVTHTRFLISEN